MAEPSDNAQELWDFDELDELEADQGSSDEEAGLPTLKAEGDTPSEKVAGGPVPSSGNDLRGKLDFLFGPGDSDSEEEEEDDEDAISQAGGAPAKKKVEFEDPRKKWTNLEDPRLRGERVPLQERVRSRLTRLAVARAQGAPPGPPGPPPPAQEGPPPPPVEPVFRKVQKREAIARTENHVELRESSTSNVAASHEFRGMRSESLPGVPSPVLLKYACRGSGAASVVPRSTALSLAIAEAQEATARANARRAAESERCAHCGSDLEHPMRCSQCMEVCYCSRACQREDWKRHRRSCGSRAVAGTASRPAEGELEQHERESEEQRQRVEQERHRLEEQRRVKLAEQRVRAEEERQRKAREERARTAELRQQRLEEARHKAEKQRQEREAQRAKEEEEARLAHEEALRAAQAAQEERRRKIEMEAYEDYLLAKLQQQELLEGTGAAQPGAAVPPVQETPTAPTAQTAPTRYLATTNTLNLYKRQRPTMGERLAALGMDELRGL